MRSNWSSMMAEKTGPGPSSDSSSPPGKSSSLETSPSYSSATPRISCAQETGSIIRITSVGRRADPRGFCRFYLRVGAVQLWVYLLERRDRRQIQTLSDLGVTPQAKVSSSLDGHGHQVCAREPQGSVHEVCHGHQRSKYFFRVRNTLQILLFTFTFLPLCIVKQLFSALPMKYLDSEK